MKKAEVTEKYGLEILAPRNKMERIQCNKEKEI